MYSLAQSVRIKGSAGEPLPTPWNTLETRLHRGQLALVAAGPGTGKSAFVLNYALKTQVPCLYFSADSDAFVQTTRALAICAEQTMAQAADTVLNHPETVAQHFAGLNIRFSYESSPNLDHIEQQMMAYEELFGEFPELVVIDNALDVQTGDAEEGQSQSLDGLMSWLHDMARKTAACVIVLHHVTGPFNDANQPIPLSGVKGQVGRVPEVILTLHKGDEYELNVSTVKNRNGKADPSGQTYATLGFDGNSMNVTDEPPSVLVELDPYARDMYEQGYWGSQ